VAVSHSEFQQNLKKGLWDTGGIPLTALCKIGFVFNIAYKFRLSSNFLMKVAFRQDLWNYVWDAQKKTLQAFQNHTSYGSISLKDGNARQRSLEASHTEFHQNL
jgi:hypothetical protein